MPTWMFSWAVAIGCVVALDIGRRYLHSTKRVRSHPLPPGPPGLPFVGNVFEINTNAPWLTYTQWAKSYGDLVYSCILGIEVIIINSDAVAKDLLERRNYSDRPHLVTNELCGTDFNSALLPYGDRWRLHRRIFHQTFRKESALRFVPFQHQSACQFLRRLLVDPDRLSDHVFEFTTAIILKSTYDYDSTSGKDDIVEIVGKVLEVVVRAMRTDVAIIISVFPPLLKLPSWLPGMSFKKSMATAKELSKQYVERPFEFSVQKMRNGGTSPSMISDVLCEAEGKGISLDEASLHALKSVAATGFMAGSETSNSVLMTFFLMMVLFSEAQEKAQAEIDAVVGRNRLPTLEDRPLLPYVDAVFRETLRYRPVVPLSLPRAAVDDDVYAGYHIPKGAMIIANTWSMAHDESKYPRPYEFIPERFIDNDGSLKSDDVENITFGFGRRICPGQHFADTAVWSVIATFLATFDIRPPLDENGSEICIEPEFTSGVAVVTVFIHGRIACYCYSQPLPFGFRIVPRISGMDVAKLEELIAASAAS